LLPWPSCLSVSCCPETRLRHWSSLRYLRISLLHRKFQSPLQHSSHAVSNAVSGLSPKISHPTCATAYAPFTPNESEQRLRPLYYRGCWHRVSRLFLLRYHQFAKVLALQPCSRMTGVYNPKTLSSTRRRSIRVAPIVKDSRLLPPVGVWTVSQFQCGWSSSKTSYPSSPWWAFTPPTS
jgi:hypothetical protein